MTLSKCSVSQNLPLPLKVMRSVRTPLKTVRYGLKMLIEAITSLIVVQLIEITAPNVFFSIFSA